MDLNESNVIGIVISTSYNDYKVVFKGDTWSFMDVKTQIEYPQSGFKDILRHINNSEIISFPKSKIHELWSY